MALLLLADEQENMIDKYRAPYVWGAKGPNRFDCSGLVYWSVNEVDPELGSAMHTNAVGQAKWCYTTVLSFREI
jgi:hypothetical protein